MLCILGAQVTLFTVFWSHITMPADETWQTQKRWHADLQSLPPSPSSSDNLHRPMWGKKKRHKGYESLYTRVGAFHRTPFYYFPPHHLKKLLGSILYTLLHIGPSSSHSRQFLFFFCIFFFWNPGVMQQLLSVAVKYLTDNITPQTQQTKRKWYTRNWWKNFRISDICIIFPWSSSHLVVVRSIRLDADSSVEWNCVIRRASSPRKNAPSASQQQQTTTKCMPWENVSQKRGRKRKSNEPKRNKKISKFGCVIIEW